MTDPDAPIHAVLAAANAAVPRVRRVDGGRMIDARYEVPTGRPEGDAFATVLDHWQQRIEEPGEVVEPARDVPWSIRDHTGREIAVYWGEPGGVPTRADMLLQAIPVTDADEAERYREDYLRGEHHDDPLGAAIDEAKRRTLRDTGSVIT